jgi:hypothetical protein
VVTAPRLCDADDPVRPGQHRLERGDGDGDRDGLIYVPRGYS